MGRFYFDLLYFTCFSYIFVVLADSNFDTCSNKNSSDTDIIREVMKCLLKSYDHSATLSRNIEVKMTYRASDLFYVEGQNMQSRFFLFGEFKMSWIDPNFAWTKEDYSVSRVFSRNVVGIWKPDIYLNDLSNYNTDRVMFRSPVISPQSAGSVRILNTGEVRYRLGTTLVVLCDSQDLTRFPYDVKTCKMELFAPGNVSLVPLDGTKSFRFVEPLTTHHILATNVTFKSSSDLDPNVAKSSVTLSVTFVRHSTMHDIKLQTPNMGLCLFLLLPLWLSPSNVLRLLLPTTCFLFTLYQMQELNAKLGHTLYAGPIFLSEQILKNCMCNGYVHGNHTSGEAFFIVFSVVGLQPRARVFEPNRANSVTFYQAITIISIAILIYNFYCSLIWKQKVFLPPLLNRIYASLYARDWYKKLMVAQNYLEIEQECSENSENLEATFHIWSELLRIMDIVLFVILFIVEMYYFLPTTKLVL